jgi:chromosome segregation ATPase
MLKGRISNAVHSFVANASWFSTSLTDSVDTYGSTGPPTLDMARRRLRFVAAFIAPDNEENMASLAHGADISSRRSVCHLRRDLERCHVAIEKHSSMETAFVATQKALESRLAAKSILFDRQMADWKGLVEREAKALVQVHTIERQKAEIQASQMSRQLADAQRTVQECQEAEKRSQTALDNATSELNTVVAREESLARRVELSEAEVRRLSEELRVTKDLQGRTQATEKELKDRISDQDELIEQLECSEGEIRESLENLFGDMVSLAQLYIMKEKEEAAYRESAEGRIDKLQQRLESERQRNAELEARDKRNQYENEVLSKNYAKAREKLDKEREERRKEADQRRKRSGPISYINQLHSNVDRDTSRKGSSSSTGSKENNNSASASGSTSRSKSSSAR